jgi:hypothetical protein
MPQTFRKHLGEMSSVLQNQLDPPTQYARSVIDHEESVWHFSHQFEVLAVPVCTSQIVSHHTKMSVAD